ncbi:hypothetical protein [Enterococcus sp. HY326]|uniref:hypothetical protein n=1 Tax=Enterococcus sp. HY326 TaxID=2971265 RepID=UPI00223F3A48|nr:hypothetical protein [Enterococcus sp. HY326]
MTGCKDCWQILEIAATTDERAIKKAYAKKLKAINVEENPDEFQELKAAFDAARTYNPTEELGEEFINESDEIIGFTVENFEEPDNAANISLSEFENFQVAFRRFKGNENYYHEVIFWQVFIKETMPQELAAISKVLEYLRKFLASEYLVLSSPVRRFLLNLCQDVSEKKNKQAELQWKQAILHFPDFDFSFYAEIPKSQRYLYVKNRSQIYLLFSEENRLAEIAQLLTECREIYACDYLLEVYQCYLLLFEDHSFFKKSTFDKFYHHLKNLPDFPGRRLIVDYIRYHHHGAAQDVSRQEREKQTRAFFQPVVEELPKTIYELILGSVAFESDDRQRAIAYLTPFKDYDPPVLTKYELAYLEGGKHLTGVSERILPEQFKKGHPLLFFGVLLLLFVIFWFL